MRQLYPVLWVATLGLAAAVLLRPGGLGTLIALAANWENVPWSDTYTPPMPRTVTVPQGATGPSGPSTSSRPAAWPGAMATVSDLPDPGPRERRPAPSTTNSLRFSPPLAASPTKYPETNPEIYAPAPPAEQGRPGETEGAAPVQAAGRGNVPADPGPVDPGPSPLQDMQRRWIPPDSRPGRQSDVPDPWATSVPPAGEPGPDREISARPPVAAAEPPAVNAIPCEGAEMLGRVGSEVILAKELSMGIAELRAKNAKVPAEALEAEIRKVLKQRLDQKVEEKLIYLDAKRTIPSDNFPKIKDNVAREFESSQVPRLMKGTNARTRQEMETALEAAGTSLEMQKRNFVEQVLAHEWLKQQTKFDEDVSHDQALEYYQEHAAQYEKPSRARWEQLTVKVSRFPSREEAYAALAQMGNQIVDGAPLAGVAKAQSHGATAHDGGRWDWTTRGSLASQAIDRAIFGDGQRPGLPLNALSPILEEEQALHIIRVTEREPSRRVPFVEAQVEIKKKIRAEREAKAKQDYLAKLRRETPVWTAFDTATAAATPFSMLR